MSAPTLLGCLLAAALATAQQAADVVDVIPADGSGDEMTFGDEGGDEMTFGDQGAGAPSGPAMTIEEEGPATPAVRPVEPPRPARDVLAVPAPLDVRVTVRRVVAGSIRIVPLEIRAPAGVTSLWGTTTLGELHGPDRLEPGLFEAHITLPAVRGPVVILAVFEGNGCAGYVRIPVWKAANLEIQSEPRAEVRVEIAGQVFGPVRATGRSTTVPVEIAPGADAARVIARDAAGNETTSTLSLPVGRFPLARIQLRETTILADDAQVLPVLVAVTDEHGGLPAEYAFETETGALGEPAEIQSGLRLYTWRPSRALGEMGLIVRTEDGEARQGVTMVPGPPVGIEIQALPNILPANGVSSSTIYAGVSDGLGHYIDAGAIEMEILGGQLIQAPAQSGPVVVAAVAAERMIRGAGAPPAIVVLARGGGHEGRVAIRQFDPDARGLRLTPGQTQLPADGESRTDIRVEVLDGLGDPLPVNDRVELSALGGAVPAGVDVVNGNGTFSFQAGTQAGIATIRAGLQGARAHATVTLASGIPMRLRLAAEPAGALTWTVRARLEDRHGNGVAPDAGISFAASADRGTLEELTAAEVGGPEDVGWMTGTLALSPDDAGAEVQVAAGPWTERVRVTTGERAKFYLELSAGYVHDLGAAGFIPLRLGIGWNDAFGARGLLFGAEVGYLALRESLLPRPAEAYDLIGDALTVYGVVGYRWPVTRWLVLIGALGAGMEMAWLRVQPASNEPAETADAAVAFSIGVRLGFGFPVGPGLIALQLAYDDARHGEVMRGNVGGLGGLLGYRLEI